jgi:hypothetical protein
MHNKSIKPMNKAHSVRKIKNKTLQAKDLSDQYEVTAIETHANPSPLNMTAVQTKHPQEVQCQKQKSSAYR